VHLAAGNHDDPGALIARFGDTPYLGNGVSPSYVVEYPQATIVIANSWMLGRPAGYLGREQLAWIDGTLADAAGLADVIRRHPHVTRVLAVAPAPRWRCPGLSDPHPPLCAQSRRIAVGYKELPAVARKTPARKTPARQAPMVRPERPSSAALARGALDAEVRKERTPRWAQPGELDYGAHWHRCPRLLPWRAPR